MNFIYITSGSILEVKVYNQDIMVIILMLKSSGLSPRTYHILHTFRLFSQRTKSRPDIIWPEPFDSSEISLTSVQEMSRLCQDIVPVCPENVQRLYIQWYLNSILIRKVAQKLLFWRLRRMKEKGDMDSPPLLIEEDFQVCSPSSFLSFFSSISLISLY